MIGRFFEADAEMGERQRAEMERLKVEPFPDFEDWLNRENQRQIKVDFERRCEVTGRAIKQMLVNIRR